jgi:hypothetical protein
MRTALTLLGAFLLLAFPAAGTGASSGKRLLVGAAEDASKQADLDVAREKMALAARAGMSAIRVSASWNPGVVQLDGGDLILLQNSATAAQEVGIRLFVSIAPRVGKSAPRTPAGRKQFAAYAVSVASQLGLLGVTDFIIGNEPNIGRFWSPQFTAKGADAAAPAYELLLAQTYDALKALSPAITVLGGAVSPRGLDKPGTGRDTHSPTTFIRDLGKAYRKTKRRRPIMDAFAFHPYMEKSRISPTLKHPRTPRVISINDYDKLVGLLGEAFDGTAQAGSSLPILYDEFGVQSTIAPRKVGVYANTASPVASDAVPEKKQADYYRIALQLAACQPNVIGLLFFHVTDEFDLAAWQSGLYYADDTPKSSLEAVRTAFEKAHSGKLADCREPPAEVTR